MVGGRHTDVPIDAMLEGDDVRLRIPPYAEYLRTIRLVAADAARRAGLDLDEIEDFRIAVDELAHFLMTATDHEITLTFGVLGSCVVARGAAQRRPGAGQSELGDLSHSIVSSVADFFGTSEHATELAFSVMKQRAALVTSP